MLSCHSRLVAYCFVSINMSTPPNVVPPVVAPSMDLTQFCQFQAQQMSQLTQAVQQLAQSQQATAQTQQSLPSRPQQDVQSAPVPPFRPFIEEKETWHEWLVQFTSHLTAYNVQGTVKLPFFLACAGVVVYRTASKLFPTTSPESVSYDALIEALSKYYDEQVHVAAARFKFFRSRKQDGQTYRQWLAELQGLTRDCKFRCSCGEYYNDSMIRDVITQNVPDNRIREQILRHADPTLQQVMQIIDFQDASELAKSSFDPVGVCTVSTARQGKLQQNGPAPTQGARPAGRSAAGRKHKPSTYPARGKVKSCPRCFSKHTRDNCPSHSATCFACGKLGHVRSVCLQQHKGSTEQARTGVRSHHINVVHSPSPTSDKTVERASSQPVSSQARYRNVNKLFVDLEILGQTVTFLLDTGASVSLLNRDTYSLLGQPPCRTLARCLRRIMVRTYLCWVHILVMIHTGPLQKQ